MGCHILSIFLPVRGRVIRIGMAWAASLHRQRRMKLTSQCSPEKRKTLAARHASMEVSAWPRAGTAAAAAAAVEQPLAVQRCRRRLRCSLAAGLWGRVVTPPGHVELRDGRSDVGMDVVVPAERTWSDAMRSAPPCRPWSSPSCTSPATWIGVAPLPYSPDPAHARRRH